MLNSKKTACWIQEYSMLKAVKAAWWKQRRPNSRFKCVYYVLKRVYSIRCIIVMALMPSSLFQDLLFWWAQACACAALRTELCSRRVFSWSIDLLVRNNSSPTILDLLVRNNLNSSANNNSSARGEIRRSADNARIDAQVKAPICRVARGSVPMLGVETLSLSATKKPVHKGMLRIVRVCIYTHLSRADPPP